MNVSKLEPPNLSGGYIWVYDNDNTEVSQRISQPSKRTLYPSCLA